MAEVITLSLVCLAAFVFAATLGYALNRLRRQPAAPATGARLRLRAGDAVFRSRFEGVVGGVWTVTAPLARDRYVPLRVGEPLVVETTGTRGVRVFRTEVVARDGGAGTLALRPPSAVHELDRRLSPRFLTPGTTAFLGPSLAEWAELVDIGMGGACLRVTGPVHVGEVLRMRLPWSEEAVAAEVVATDGLVAHVRFREAQTLPAAIRRLPRVA